VNGGLPALLRPRRDAELLARYRAGEKAEALAETYGLARRSVYHALRRAAEGGT
jgi:Mor family transcriptional regulator